MENTKINIRELILDGLLTLEREPVFSNQLIKDILDKYDYLEQRDKAFLKRVFEGTIERKIELDYHLDRYSSVPVRKQKPLIRCLLRMSTYQILYMDAVPDSAVVNEAVKLARKRKFQNLSGFVNGVLRHVASDKQQLVFPDKEKEPLRYFSVRYSVPEWIVSEFLKQFSPQQTEQILQGLLEIHPVSLRFKRGLSERQRESLVERISQESGCSLLQDKRLPYVYLASHLDNISLLPGFAEGDFLVQDVSSALSVEHAEIKEGDLVVDVCAAPGGKSLLAAELCGPSGKVISRDQFEGKVERILENARRMRAENLQAEVFDGTRTDETLVEKADVVILDVPCSGLGILGKKRDIKYNVSPESVEEIQKLQWKIVEASWPYVKPGGVLLYSTCTIRPQENTLQVKRICEELPFTLEGDMTQLLPGIDHCDGFFYARLRRNS